jgi:aspartate-semialdehyde dehydrogenase
MKTGIIGWRGMVGSVLMERMNTENDLAGLDVTFFSTSNAGGKGPQHESKDTLLADAYNIDELTKYDVLVTCQGGAYTSKVYPELRKTGWKGYWIDAASTLRMSDDTSIILDPINRDKIDLAIDKGIKTFAGGNCTVSLMLMALGGLFKNNWVEWLTSMTYQAASGAGAANMLELVNQSAYVGNNCQQGLTALETDASVTQLLSKKDFPKEAFGYPLAYSLLPWIDSEVENGQSKEEWKGMAETNKILQSEKNIPIDGLCVRVSSLRCHSQAYTIKLKSDIPMNEIESAIESNNEWVNLVPNTKEETLSKLTPAAISGSLNIPVGRLHKMNLGPEYLTAFSVGDQLLWGAAEPLRRMLNILKEK